jgi:hypothetical protein
MKIKDIPALDYRHPASKQEAQNKLLELPFFKKYDDVEDISFEKLEAAMIKLQKKYPVRLSYIMSTMNNDPPSYSLMMKHEATHAHITTVYATSLREGYEKALIYGFHYCKKFFSED